MKQNVQLLLLYVIKNNNNLYFILGNRWRRQLLSPDLREEVMPKNILMVGPTGVGKTEIARRLAKLSQAPFIKVEATKYTEVGFVGRDVESIIRDLVQIAMQQTKQNLKKKFRPIAKERAIERALDELCGKNDKLKNQLRPALLRGELDERTITIRITPPNDKMFELEDYSPQKGYPILNLNALLGRPPQEREVTDKIKNCMKLLEEDECEKMISLDMIQSEAIRATENDGIVFIDEIDKICSGPYNYGKDASSEGVQRDLLPLIEGTTVTTKFGPVKTDHILFIASGAFTSVKPKDLLAELQGRLPIRVELKGLTKDDLHRILTEPENNIIRQNTV